MNTPDRMYHGDEWEIAGNIHLLEHIKRTLAANPRHYGDPGVMLGGRYVTQPSPQYVANVQRLVAAKKAWAEEMAMIAVGGEVPVKTQKADWAEFVGAAEAELER